MPTPATRIAVWRGCGENVARYSRRYSRIIHRNCGKSAAFRTFFRPSCGNSYGYGNLLAGLGQKKGNSPAILLLNQHIQTVLPMKTKCFQWVSLSDNKLALAEPKRHFSTKDSGAERDGTTSTHKFGGDTGSKRGDCRGLLSRCARLHGDECPARYASGTADRSHAAIAAQEIG